VAIYYRHRRNHSEANRTETHRKKLQPVANVSYKQMQKQTAKS